MCIFCEVQQEKSRIILENELAFAIYDGFPVSMGHSLIIPKRHVESFFDLRKDEFDEIIELILNVKTILQDKYNPDGFNVGFNDQTAAGQTIFHCHVHIIPRYYGDVLDPKGGIRGVIPSKKSY